MALFLEWLRIRRIVRHMRRDWAPRQLV